MVRSKVRHHHHHPMITQYVPKLKGPLQQALDDFNLVFDYDLHLPMIPEHIETAADMAELRGRVDIAQALRLALKQTLEVDE